MSRNTCALILGCTALALCTAVWFGPGETQAKLQAMAIPGGAITAAYALIQEEREP